MTKMGVGCLIGWIAVGLLAIGYCRSNGDDPIGKFREKQPQEAKKYTYLEIASLKAARLITARGQRDAWNVAATVLAKFGDLPGVREYAEKVVENERKNVEMFEKDMDSLEGERANGGSVCEYERTEGEMMEIGFLVLRNGEVVKRMPIYSEPAK